MNYSMKSLFRHTRLAAIITILGIVRSSDAAVIFTNDTLISFKDSSFDGAEVVVSNCVVTMDGAHSFANLQVLSGGVLTHSFSTNGLLEDRSHILSEPHLLTDTNLETLLYANVVQATIIVRDQTGAITYTNLADYQILPTTNNFTALQRTTNSTIPDGGTVLVDYDVLNSVVAAGLTLNITNDLLVAQGGAIRADFIGYGAGLGPGQGTASGGSYPTGSGAGYGGYGGIGSSNSPTCATYGLIHQPPDLGSGGGRGYGGPGGPGGGAIRLTAGRLLQIDGVISANGANATNSRSGGGSGGGVRLTASLIAGAGAISANGGAGEPSLGGGGSGGRIALNCATNQFSGFISAHGGLGFQSGGAGTIYVQTANQTNAVITIDNAMRSGAATPLFCPPTSDLVVSGKAVVQPASAQVLGNLVVRSNGWLSTGQLATFNLTVNSNATIEAGGGIDMDGLGGLGNSTYGGQGPGTFSSLTGGGGGHAGYGGSGGPPKPGGAASPGQGGNYYDSAIQPNFYGSGGGGSSTYPGGAGGGAVRFTVLGSLLLNGTISADGTSPLAYGAGGGSGGSIWLTLGSLSGSGRISANGGSAFPSSGGGGSGGRIAIYYDTDQFAGTISAQGGSGYGAGAAGTIYSKNSSDSIPQLLVDNGGLPGTNTLLMSVSGIADLTLRAGAAVGPATSYYSTPGPSGFRNLTIGSNAWFSPTPSSGSTVTVSSNAIIESGGVLSLDGLGYPSSQGPGSGRYYSGTPSCGSGGGCGGYGGIGAAGPTSTPGGNTAYDPLTSPTYPGSGGGGYFSSYYGATGGAGGGSLRLNVTGLLKVDGKLSANGIAGYGGSAGGGAGGSLWLTASTLAGSGIISADGGAGELPGGGGGGGGRIAVYYSTNQFTGTFSAKAGSGYAAGGAGTIYLKGSNDDVAQLIADNGGLIGTNTPLATYSPIMVDLTLRGGASSTNVQYNTPIRNLLVSSNSSLYLSFSSQQTWTISGNATIQAGGRITADGSGYPYDYRSSGLYSGYPQTGGSGGGGGHGGYGGKGLGGAGGMAVPDPIYSAYPGGSGGIYSSIARPEGAGGGALRMNVIGLLTVNGRLSADGNSSYTSSDGGGAGGGIQLSVGGLVGSGVISACGGNGDMPYGGGGGGGCISLTYQSNLFSGRITVKGGQGYVAGGAGTIYTKQNNQPQGQFTVDNEDVRGTNTLVGLYGGFGSPDLVVKRSAGVAFSSASQYLNSLRIESNSIVLLTNQSLTIYRDATIQASSAIIADGTGSGPASGMGAGSSYATLKGGGGHGGMGGANLFNNSYDSVFSPTMPGSGGGNGSGTTVAPFGGAGGGIVRLTVNGALALDGAISANGLPGAANSGGGSGGSVFITAGTLIGTGAISANGGAGNGNAGGGGGGRVALYYSSNLFTGTLSATGGGGLAPGGAGTIYTKPNTVPYGQLRIDNGGLLGTNTPLSTPSALDLTISGGAVVHPSSSYLLLSNLFIGSQSALTASSINSNLEVVILRDAVVQPNGAISVDGKGFSMTNGPGAGLSDSGFGSGGGYGGPGGASVTVPGGPTYGSAQTPTDRGSGGGAGIPIPGGSEGGGAIRLNVGGTLTVDGVISANGNPGVQDSSGGGSGGSVWITAGALSGSGQITADGGSGEFGGGGGGGGGRIALYFVTNHFLGGISASGGPGFVDGGTGTVFTANYAANLQVLAQAPVGIVSDGVKTINLTFSAAVDPSSFGSDDVQLITPNGPLAQSNFVVSASGTTAYRVSFPQQTAVGDYTFQIGPAIQDLFGFPMSQVYTGAFTIALPTIQGTILDTNGLPVPGVAIVPTGPVSPAVTDTNGNYTIGAPPGTTFSLVPSKPGLYFVPGWRSYTNVAVIVTNENYLAVPSLIGNLTVSVQDTNLLLRCYGLSGVNYQVLSSTNLLQWLPYSDWFPGTNGPLEVLAPVATEPMRFFRIQAQN